MYLCNVCLTEPTVWQANLIIVKNYNGLYGHAALRPDSFMNDMNKIICSRIDRLREVMRRESIDAFIFPSTDPHNGEYVPAHWEGRKWISGFDGSAGTAVVTMDTLPFGLTRALS